MLPLQPVLTLLHFNWYIYAKLAVRWKYYQIIEIDTTITTEINYKQLDFCLKIVYGSLS